MWGVQALRTFWRVVSVLRRRDQQTARAKAGPARTQWRPRCRDRRCRVWRNDDGQRRIDRRERGLQRAASVRHAGVRRSAARQRHRRPDATRMPGRARRRHGTLRRGAAARRGCSALHRMQTIRARRCMPVLRRVGRCTAIPARTSGLAAWSRSRSRRLRGTTVVAGDADDGCDDDRKRRCGCCGRHGAGAVLRRRSARQWPERRAGRGMR